MAMKREKLTITRAIVVTIKKMMSGFVNEGLMEYSCSRVTIKKLANMIVRIKRI